MFSLLLKLPSKVSRNLGAIQDSDAARATDIAELNKLIPAAEHGDQWIQFGLGVRYADGQGTPQDIFTAAKWYTLSAIQGEPDSLKALYSIFVKEIYGPQNVQAAFKRMTPAAEQGNALIQNLMGDIYRRGAFEVHDHKLAFKWYGRAAKQDLASAQINLGRMYERGEGVAQDYGAALKWYTLGARQNLDSNLNRMRKLKDSAGVSLAVWNFFQHSVQWMQRLILAQCTLPEMACFKITNVHAGGINSPPNKKMFGPKKSWAKCIYTDWGPEKITPSLSCGTTSPPHKVAQKR